MREAIGYYKYKTELKRYLLDGLRAKRKKWALDIKTKYPNPKD